MVAPARKIDYDLLIKGSEILESWGLKVKMGKHCRSDENKYLAASDEDRLSDLQMMLDRTDINAIICARGGYGTTRILDDLNFEVFQKNPKWIVGFSDITALHLKLHNIGVESIHGLMPGQFHKEEYRSSMNSVKSILFGEGTISLQAEANTFNRVGISSGQVIGGNLSLVVDSLGTQTSPDTKGKILVLEEIDEPLYKVDRMLTQLKRAGKLAELSGLIIGHMTDISDTTLPFGETIEEIVLNKVKNYSYPVAFNFPIGHEAPNLAWLHAGAATIEITNHGSILRFD